jgi:hypothetical protein
VVRKEVEIFASPQSERQQDSIGKVFKVARIFFSRFWICWKKIKILKFLQNEISFNVLGPFTKHQIDL